MKVDGWGRIGVHHKDLVIRGTRNGRGGGYLAVGRFGSHESLLRERISKHNWLGSGHIRRSMRGGVLSAQCGLRLPHLPQLGSEGTIVGVKTINTATQTWLICAKRPIRRGLSALLLVGSVRVHTRIGSTGTRGRLVLIASPPSLRRRGIGRALLCKYLPWRGL